MASGLSTCHVVLTKMMQYREMYNLDNNRGHEKQKRHNLSTGASTDVSNSFMVSLRNANMKLEKNWIQL